MRIKRILELSKSDVSVCIEPETIDEKPDFILSISKSASSTGVLLTRDELAELAQGIAETLKEDFYYREGIRQ